MREDVKKVGTKLTYSGTDSIVMATASMETKMQVKSRNRKLINIRSLPNPQTDSST